jgi:hypothetical protein
VNPGSDPTKTPYAPGGLTVFYCPSNWFWDGDTPGPTNPPTPPTLSHWPEDFMYQRGRIKYWYYGNPNPEYPQYHYRGSFGGALPGSPPATNPGGSLDWRFWDTNRNGDNRDEFIVKLGDKNMSKICVMTDHSRQAGFFGPFQFVHGSRQNPLAKGWKNNLYGDGHAETKRPRRVSFSADGMSYINQNPDPDEIQPRWGNANAYQMW